MSRNGKYDVVIIGGGPAGLAAGIYCGRAGLRTLVLDAKTPGGRAAEAAIVENYPGFASITGSDLALRLHEHCEKYAEVKSFGEVIDVRGEVGEFQVTTRQDSYRARAVVLAFGASRRKLSIKGEDEFAGRGVSYCASCDGPLFGGKTVCVVGSGNEMVEDALYLSGIVSELCVISNSERFEALPALIERLKTKKNVKLMENIFVEDIFGDEVVRGIVVRDGASRNARKIDVAGVFIAVGIVPLKKIAEMVGVKLDERGYIIVDSHQRTSVDGVFAAGDCRGLGFQIITAAGSGAMAAMSAISFVHRLGK